jgi:hypothetical protein
MCIDYTSLNKAYPKDEYPLPCICQIVDSTMSCELLSFLDAYSSYHQISLTIDDEEKIAFVTLFGIFYYIDDEDGIWSQEWGSYISEGHSDYLANSN